MMILNRAHLIELFDRIRKVHVDDVIDGWRRKLSTEHTLCQTCPFEDMMGRRCCCMCLESSLADTSLRLHDDPEIEDRIPAVISSVKSHRSQSCAQCASVKT